MIIYDNYLFSKPFLFMMWCIWGPSTLGALFIGYICQNMHVYKELMIHIKLMTL